MTQSGQPLLSNHLNSVNPSRWSVSSIDELHPMLTELRPELHRYCARMTGSSVDGEDLVQTTLLKAVEAFERAAPVENLRAWLFRIAHNSIVDQSRREKVRAESSLDENEHLQTSHLESNTFESGTFETKTLGAALNDLEWLMTLSVLQRSVLILSAGFGYSAEECSKEFHCTVASVKSALSRARNHLKTRGEERLTMSEEQLKRLKLYSALFNQGDFDGLMSLVNDEVKLDMVAKAQMAGRKDIRFYFDQYAQTNGLHMEPGFVDRRPAVGVFDTRTSSDAPQYFIHLDFESDVLRFIRDFRYARYVMDTAEWKSLEGARGQSE